MPNPLRESVDLVKSDLPNLPTGTTVSVAFPTDSTLAAPHVQVAWDGSPSTADNREDATTRITVWAPRGQLSVAIDTAEGLMVRLLDTHTAATQRVGRGSGRLAGTDPTTGLPFCTFTIAPVFLAPAP